MTLSNRFSYQVNMKFTKSEFLEKIKKILWNCTFKTLKKYNSKKKIIFKPYPILDWKRVDAVGARPRESTCSRPRSSATSSPSTVSRSRTSTDECVSHPETFL